MRAAEGRIGDRQFMMVKLLLMVLALCSGAFRSDAATAEPSAERPLVVRAETKEIHVFGRIYAKRFNDAQGAEAHYHLLVWNKGTSPTALIETPVDDLDFHTALVKLGATPGNNLTMASWTERNDEHSTAARKKVAGSEILIRVAWKEKPEGIPISAVFSQPLTPNPQSAIHNPQSPPQWRFGGNRDRLFNQIPLGSRPGCLVCLYSCPSGKVSNSALSVHDYIAAPSRFVANTNLLPVDGTPVIVTFRLHD